MQQSDVQPSRLLRAKQKIIQLLKLRGDSKTALVAYAGSSHVVMPISNDQQMIRHFLDSLSHKIMPVQGKIPESVLPITEALLSSFSVPGTLLMIGDGASIETSAEFGRYFQKDGSLSRHQLLVWGIGQKESQLTVGSSIIPMQYEQLNTLAKQSNGRFIPMTFDQQDVTQVERYIEYNLVIVDDKARPWLDSGYPLTFFIAILFLFWFRKGWTLQW
jgi:Ca-activated chloride channel family protein